MYILYIQDSFCQFFSLTQLNRKRQEQSERTFGVMFIGLSFHANIGRIRYGGKRTAYSEKHRQGPWQRKSIGQHRILQRPAAYSRYGVIIWNSSTAYGKSKEDMRKAGIDYAVCQILDLKEHVVDGVREV